MNSLKQKLMGNQIGVRAGRKQILPFEEALDRFPQEERRALEVAFISMTDKDDLSGKLKKARFQEICFGVPILKEVAILDPEDNKALIECVFRGFDRGGKGYISFEDLVIGYIIVSYGTATERLRLTFRLYDWDENGYVSKNDFLKIYAQVMAHQDEKGSAERGGKKGGDWKEILSGEVDKIYRDFAPKGSSSDKLYPIDLEKFFRESSRSRNLKSFIDYSDYAFPFTGM